MQRFTAMVVEMMKREGLFYWQGGPIIMAQVFASSSPCKFFPSPKTLTGFGVCVLESGLRVQGLRIRVFGFGIRARFQGLRIRVLCFRIRV
jgi:hypothetical protein